MWSIWFWTLNIISIDLLQAFKCVMMGFDQSQKMANFTVVVGQKVEAQKVEKQNVEGQNSLKSHNCNHNIGNQIKLSPIR